MTKMLKNPSIFHRRAETIRMQIKASNLISGYNRRIRVEEIRA